MKRWIVDVIDKNDEWLRSIEVDAEDEREAFEKTEPDLGRGEYHGDAVVKEEL